MPILWEDDDTDQPLPTHDVHDATPTFTITTLDRINLLIRSPWAAPAIILVLLAAVILLVTVRATADSPGGVRVLPPVASDPATPSSLIRDSEALRDGEVWVQVEPASTTNPTVPTTWPWDALANCESGGNWHEGDGGLGPYRGGLQWHPDTWVKVKPPTAPSDPATATRTQEIAAAETLLDQPWGGFFHWPNCAREIGLIP